MKSEPQMTEYGKISGELSRDRLADLCVDKIGVQTGPFGSQLHNEDYVEVGTPIITVEHLGDNRILHENTPCVSDEDKQRLSKYHLQVGDIVFSRVGSVDRRALVRDEEDGWLFSGRCLRVRVDKNKIDEVYLSYFFGLATFKNYIRSIAVGATMPSINTKILSEVPIYYPSFDEQKSIAEILYSIDEKIELNRQINQTLEHIAQAIFKSWFVDFEPVKAKIEAKQNGQAPDCAAMRAISGKSDEELNRLTADQHQQLTATAALFPDELEESEVGLIPKGWSFEETQNLFEVKDGTHDSPKQVAEGYPLVTSRHITTDFIDFSKTYLISKEDYEQVNNRSKVDHLDILLTMIGTVGESFLVQQKDIHFAIKNVGLFKTSQNPNLAVYLFLFLRTPKMKQYIETRMAGTTQKYITLKALRTIPVLLPDIATLESFNNRISNIYQQVDNLNEQNESLASTRDALLPKLLAGDIKL